MASTTPTKADLLRIIKENDVQIIHLWFTDILGVLKSFGITIHQLEEAIDEGLGFDGSSVEGFARIHESDLIALPDPDTLQILPFKIGGQTHARFICNIHNPDGSPYAGDPRWVLRRALDRAAQEGFTYYVGPELEYFYLTGTDDPEPLDRAGYFDLTPDNLGNELRQRTIEALHSMGIAVEVGHHEVAPSQHEIDLKYGPALAMADARMTYRYLVKEIARQNGFYATFMPKPIFGQNGNGMHVHQSLFRGGSNAFFDEKGRFHLSAAGQAFMAGLLEHARAFCAVTNQWVNSYKRLVPGYEAPVYLSWGQRNRSALIRVPMYKPGKEKSTRVEFRGPDPACNPYLAFAVMLSAGLDGMHRSLPLGEPVEEDIYHMTPKERQARGIDTLPDSLNQAIVLTERSKLVREALGEHVFVKFIENKKIEWDEYRLKVTDYELEKYLPML
jgi:glutamine synthetase